MNASNLSREQLSRLIDRGGLIKICGLREEGHAATAAMVGADLIGFIFAPARRQVTAATARSCINAARQAATDRTLIAVGVFVDASLLEIERVVEVAGLDAVQLHGSEPAEFIESLSVPAFKALRPRANSTASDVISEIDRYRSAASAPVAILVDGYSDIASGGTGARADWTMAAEINAQVPILLAGGLDSRNVAAAIRQVRPQGVDVSSGVEIDGAKDPSLINQFVRAARATFSE